MKKADRVRAAWNRYVATEKERIKANKKLLARREAADKREWAAYQRNHRSPKASPIGCFQIRLKHGMERRAAMDAYIAVQAKQDRAEMAFLKAVESAYGKYAEIDWTPGYSEAIVNGIKLTGFPPWKSQKAA